MSVNFENLAIVSILTTLSTEAIKNILSSLKVRYISNVIAVSVSIVLSVIVGIVKPVIFYQTEITASVIFDGAVLAFFSVLCATLSFDKVKQVLDRLKGFEE